eukprot:15036482-Ditylum_brightwellii.AAC.1
MLQVGAFVEAGFVQPVCDAGAVCDAHVAAAAWGSGKGAVHGNCHRKKLKGVEDEYPNELCWQLPAPRVLIGRVATYAMKAGIGPHRYVRSSIDHVVYGDAFCHMADESFPKGEVFDDMLGEMSIVFA